MFHYDESTVLLYLRKTDFVLDVYASTQTKAKEVFGKLEDIVVEKKLKQIETAYEILKTMIKSNG